MNRSQVVGALLLGLSLLLAGCQARPVGAGGGADGRQKGNADAERDIKSGVLKLKEYPPLPYSLEEMRYIKLLKERCHVEHEVLSDPGKEKEQDLRAEVEAYNSAMNAQIKKKYGADILDRLRKEAARR